MGLSTGIPGKDYSLCGSFASLSKVVLLFVMVRGRHRGLPLAIDRSILLPGEELMRRMDEEYNVQGNYSPDDVEKLVSDIEESGRYCTETGKGEQDPKEQNPSQLKKETDRDVAYWG